MGHHHPHGHGHGHHSHDEASIEPSQVLDSEIPDSELAPADVSRRSLLRGAGLLGAGAAASVLGSATTPAPAAAAPDTSGVARKGGYLWLAGDHHIHTQYSPDGVYRVIDQVRHANAYGLDWMVITDHGTVQHAKIGVEKVNPDIRNARDEIRDTLVFQGLEWNIPGAEHGTVFVHPGKNEVGVLRQFENDYDGTVKNAKEGTPANEALAIAGLNFLADAVRRKQVEDAMFFANHPARQGIDSPHEIRGWRDAAPRIALGFEGAPGHQAAGLPKPLGPGSGRGSYNASPGTQSFPGYPLESYRTWGGFDWMTATVGGLWDSLLAEGKPWWITANSDCHSVYADTATRGPGSDFNNNGFYNDPVYGGAINTGNNDYWPGFYSRTNVGSSAATYAAVMAGLRAGRVWVDHGRLINGIDAQVRPSSGGPGVTLGGVLQVKRGTKVQLDVTVDLATTPNWAQFVAKLARVDVIQGDVTGSVKDRDTLTAPNTKVVKSYEVTAGKTSLRFTYDLGAVDGPVYLRLRGTDGNRSAAGYHGADVDPHGPGMDVVGDADPWIDLWFYTNPIWVLTQ
ncbi:PHP domain-containing protein [Actinopolymorpha alba]|uniref:PHP domain-containing protein n=1 Tax=Actinopolymorpha alba TaxID=533267 RepID=UPI00037C55B7|nr:PHP domain-containing protein [Actinopolymorpha alba]